MLVWACFLVPRELHIQQRYNIKSEEEEDQEDQSLHCAVTARSGTLAYRHLYTQLQCIQDIQTKVSILLIHINTNHIIDSWIDPPTTN